MSFINLQYLIPVIIFLSVFFFFYFRNNKHFFNWVEDHWFYKRSFYNKLSTGFYTIGLVLIVVALLDLRGVEKRIKGNVLDQKTIILVDSSASMLAEDVRPNRFKKALLLVKHYVKKAVGQQISLVVFSDNQKRIIPFTDDIDLVNARISRLETLDLNRGGTGLSQAIQESVEYFKASSDEVSGNILIFTDAEETELSFDIEIPKSITVGVIGIGTAKGAPIPVRNRRGESRGNKKFNGETVITKLDETFLKDLGNKIDKYRYWIATSYSLPTEEILNFFSRIDKVKQSKDEYRIRPVLTNRLLVPGVIFLILGLLLNNFKTFSIAILLIFIQSGHTQEQPEEKEPVKSEVTLGLEQRFTKGELDEKGQRILAQNLLADGFPKQADTLYGEILPKEFEPKNWQDYSNQAIAKIQGGDKAEGVKSAEKILDYLKQFKAEDTKEIRDTLQKNIVKALDRNQGGGKGKSNSKNKKKDDKNEESKDGKGGSSEKQDKKDKKDKKDQKNKDDKKKDKGKNKDSDKNKDDDKKKGKNKDKKKDSKGKGKKSKGKNKLPAILKQLINDDNQLQKKLIDAKTIERKSRQRKDW